MVPSVPVTPEPAVTGPGTTGQKVRQEPSHLDVVGVSGTNQYRTMPLESVSTCWPPTVVCDTVLPPAAGVLFALLVVPAAGALLELPELPQADTASARAASPAAPHIVRMWVSPLHGARDLPLEITCGWVFQFRFTGGPLPGTGGLLPAWDTARADLGLRRC